MKPNVWIEDGSDIFRFIGYKAHSGGNAKDGLIGQLVHKRGLQKYNLVFPANIPNVSSFCPSVFSVCCGRGTVASQCPGFSTMPCYITILIDLRLYFKPRTYTILHLSQKPVREYMCLMAYSVIVKKKELWQQGTMMQNETRSCKWDLCTAGHKLQRKGHHCAGTRGPGSTSVFFSKLSYSLLLPLSF